jgi:hypothetical protein
MNAGSGFSSGALPSVYERRYPVCKYNNMKLFIKTEPDSQIGSPPGVFTWRECRGEASCVPVPLR